MFVYLLYICLILQLVSAKNTCELATSHYNGLTTYADAYGTSQYYILEHGLRLAHQGSPTDVLIGQNPSCSLSGDTCICTYTGGSSWACSSPRRGYITYQTGSADESLFTLQNPACVYYFTVTIAIPSPTATATATPSATLTSSPQFYAQLITDTFTDIGFSTQGDRGWSYMYMDQMNIIKYMPEYDSSQKMWKFPGSYCLIQSGYIHPNTGTRCSTPNAGYCVPRILWINPNADVYTSYILYFSAAHAYYNPPAIDGTTISLRINEEDYVSYGPTPYSITAQQINHANISTVDMTLYPGSGCDYDGTSYRIQIYGYAPYPSLTTSPSASPSASESQTPSASGTATVSGSASPSRSLTPSPSRSRTRTQTQSRTPTETPLGFTTAWSTTTPSARESPSSSPKYMMTLWPSPRTISHTPSQQFIQIPYSRLPTPLTPEEEASIQNSDELTKEDLKATAMASVAIGVAGVAGGVAVISQLLNLQGQGQSQGQNQEQEQEQQQRDDQSHRRRRRLSLGDNSDDSDSDSDGTIVRIRDREQSNASEITLSRSIRNSCTDCSGTRLTLSESFPTHTIC